MTSLGASGHAAGSLCRSHSDTYHPFVKDISVPFIMHTVHNEGLNQHVGEHRWALRPEAVRLEDRCGPINVPRNRMQERDASRWKVHGTPHHSCAVSIIITFQQ